MTKKARSHRLVKLKIYKKLFVSASGCGASYTAMTDLGLQYFEREKVDFGGK